MKSIFLCNDEENFKKVYSQKTIETLKQIAGFTDEVFNEKNVKENPNNFADVDYIFSTWGMPIFTEEEIKAIFPNLKCIFYAAGTVQSFARPFLNCGVKIFSAWAANAVPVAEYTVAQIVLANKGFFKASALMSNGEYKQSRDTFIKYKGNFGAKIGIIGAGMIGKLVIKMLKAYKLEVLVFDPFLPDETAKELGVEKTSLERIFAECDVVSNHLANNEQTKGMLNKKLFASMLPYSTFLNTGRGAQVVEPDLITVLKERPDITAILDVTLPEPPEKDSELYSLSNCILTPHIAGSFGDEPKRMSEFMLCEFEKYIKGEPCDYEVTLKMLETMA